MQKQSSPKSDREEEYVNYRQFKNWDNLFKPTQQETRLLNYEFSNTPIWPGAVVVDVGFGSGSLLKWAEEKSASIVGIEIQKELLKEADSRGIKAYKTLKELGEESADFIAFMDVFEHLKWPEIGEYLMEARRVLRDGGFMIARFPNCQSPVGLIEQFGDRTHKTMLSGPVFVSALEAYDFEIIDVRGAKCIDDFGVTLFKNILVTIKRPIRFIAHFLFRVGFGTGDTLLSPSVIVVASVKKTR